MDTRDIIFIIIASVLLIIKYAWVLDHIEEATPGHLRLVGMEI